MALAPRLSRSFSPGAPRRLAPARLGVLRQLRESTQRITIETAHDLRESVQTHCGFAGSFVIPIPVFRNLTACGLVSLS